MSQSNQKPASGSKLPPRKAFPPFESLRAFDAVARSAVCARRLRHCCAIAR